MKLKCMRQKQEHNEERMQKFLDEKARMVADRAKTVARIAGERGAFEAEFRKTVQKPTMSQEAISMLAKKFNLDVEQIRTKIRKRSAMSSTSRMSSRPLSPLPAHQPEADAQVEDTELSQSIGESPDQVDSAQPVTPDDRTADGKGPEETEPALAEIAKEDALQE
jgi:hypothetical protein